MAVLISFRTARIGAALAAILLMASAPRAQQTTEAGEKAVKAAFLYNFTKFVDWPASAFRSASAPFQVCVYSEPAFRRDIEAMFAGEVVAGRRPRVSTPPAGTIGQCHVVYFAAGGTRAAELLPLLKESPALTVGEGSDFLAHGGHISFALDNERVRFDVNKAAIDRAGLTVSSKLLRVARYVQTSGVPRP